MAFNEEHYRNITLVDLLLDDYFIRSTKDPDHGSRLVWEQFFQLNPGKKQLFEEAAAVIQTMHFRQDAPATGAKERIWTNVTNQVEQPGQVVSLTGRRRVFWAVAAAVAGVILASAIWIIGFKETRIKTTTAFGEIKTIELPDGSSVTLNANSAVEYSKEWSTDETREIWLTGEAFFDVKHLNRNVNNILASERFIVHAGDLNVEVLGTSFNVSDRQAITKVVLQTGKVKIEFKENAAPVIIMEPGEIVQFNQDTKKVVKEKTATAAQLAWKKKELVLDNTSVKDVITVIENNFGYKVEVENKTILNRQLTGAGTISLEDEKTLFKSLELILGITITIKDKTLYIKDR